MRVSLEEPVTVEVVSEVYLSKELTLLKIQANQNDPLLFQTLFCATCQDFVTANGLFPAPHLHPADHALAWLPALDEPVPSEPSPAITRWLSEAPLNAERRRGLSAVALESNTLCWALIIEPEERDEWFELLTNYLDGLADAWLDALNGLDTHHFQASHIWFRPRPACRFQWLNEDVTEE